MWGGGRENESLIFKVGKFLGSGGAVKARTLVPLKLSALF